MNPVRLVSFESRQHYRRHHTTTMICSNVRSKVEESASVRELYIGLAIRVTSGWLYWNRSQICGARGMAAATCYSIVRGSRV